MSYVAPSASPCSEYWNRTSLRITGQESPCKQDELAAALRRAGASEAQIRDQLAAQRRSSESLTGGDFFNAPAELAEAVGGVFETAGEVTGTVLSGFGRGVGTAVGGASSGLLSGLFKGAPILTGVAAVAALGAGYWLVFRGGAKRLLKGVI